jgi:hypothetical protein
MLAGRGGLLRRSVGFAVALAAVAAVAFGARASGTAAAATCSTEAASAAATAAGFDVDPISKRTPINSVVCGPFFGSGSQGMAATVAVPTGCGFSIGWGVFRLDNGAWHLAMHQDNGVLKLEVVPLSDGGADIRTTQGYPRSTDPPCSPSRMRTEVWHWNGASFLAGPLKVTLLLAGFWSPVKPKRNLWCDMGNSGRFHAVSCQSGLPGERGAHRVDMGVNGGLKFCNEGKHRRCVSCVCDEGRGPVLAFGRHVDVGPFRCESLLTGIRCTVLELGKGFLITRRRTVRVG